MVYVVSAPMALVDHEDGSVSTVMRGGPVPEDVHPDHLAHLLAFGLVREAVFAGGLAPTVPGDGSEPEEFVAPAAADGPPPKAGLKEDWVAYAVSQGADQAEAEASTKDDLVAKYGA